MGRNTDELTEKLMSADSIADYLSENESRFVDGHIAQRIANAFRDRGMSKAELARRAGCSTVYVHQVFSGRRSPSRDKLICLFVGMGSGPDEIQQTLKESGFAQLYPANRRDSVILYGLAHGQSLAEIDEKLYAAGMQTLT